LPERLLLIEVMKSFVKIFEFRFPIIRGTGEVSVRLHVGVVVDDKVEEVTVVKHLLLEVR
jgi:hypothetical protein